MSTKVFIGNLPAGTTAEEVRENWAGSGAPILAVRPVEGGDPDKLAFEVELDIDARTAKLMADRRRDQFFKGRRVTVFVATPRGG
jgi:hypothetical protein